MAVDTTDVAIIGGGIMGSAVALRLAQRGVGVTVVERGIPGAEASSAAAGILGPQMEADGPGPLLELGLASRALYPSLAAELRDATGIDVGYDRSGVIAAALDEAGEAELYRFLRDLPWHPTIVSVGHRSTLRQFHDRVVELGAVT